MSRTKKSRKPGSAPTAKPKLSKQELAKVEKRVRKTTGKQAGNRQKEAAAEQQKTGQVNAKKDPRLGNKTPIALGKLADKAEKSKQANPKPAEPLAQVRFAETKSVVPEQTAEQELAAIEHDEKLLAILVKQEDDIELSEQEVDYYNDMMDRHEELSAELGIDYSDEEDDEEASEDVSEEDLWRKLDGHDLSDFEDKE